MAISPCALASDETNSPTWETRGLFYTALGKVDSSTSAALTARLMVGINQSHWNAEYHQLAQQMFIDQHSHQFKADRLNVGYANDLMRIKFGRQAINLATTFFFTPNDVFVPFAAQTFNRDYKQGVDALSTNFQLDDVSQLSIILVNNTDETVHTSQVVRYESALENMSWMIFVGNINNPLHQAQNMIGGSIQTDIFDTISFRIEANSRVNQGHTQNEWVVGLEYSSENNISLNFEWYQRSIDLTSSVLPYLNHRYAALGLSSQITPLLLGTFNIIRNTTDQSSLNTAYFNYSLSDESTVNLSLLLPSGAVATEFKAYPNSGSLEYQVYF